MKVIRSLIVYEAELFHSKGNIPKCIKNYHGNYFIDNNPGIEAVGNGDWIVTDPEGKHRAYSEEKFTETFERVGDCW